jgi:hypothetical protein
MCMKIPEDVYYSVLELSTRLVSAREVGDIKSYWQAYNDLREYCERQNVLGITHPFLWESLADFTDDDNTAIEIYKKALAFARNPEAEQYRSSIQLALAERQQSLGNHKIAYDHTLAANKAAKNLDDLELRRSISEFLLNGCLK